MKVKIFVIAAAIAALMSPLAASAATAVTLPAISFTDLSSINFSTAGTAKNAKFTVIDLNSVTKKLTKKYTLTGGTFSTTALTGGVSSALFIFDKKTSSPKPPRRALRSFFKRNSINYLEGQAKVDAVLLKTGKKSKVASGQGGVEFAIPSNTTFAAAFADLTGVTSKPAQTAQQVRMEGAISVVANIKSGNTSATFMVGAIKPTETTVETVIKNYSGVGTVSPGIHILSDDFQYLNASGAVLPGGSITSFTKIAK